MQVQTYHVGGGVLYCQPLPPEAGRQAQHEAAWSMAEEILGAARSAFDRLPGGKPFLPARPQIQFSLTHCAGLSACFVARTACGVDAESVRPLRARVLRRAFTPEEQKLIAGSPNPDEAFFRLWTLKESFVKATGEGLSRPLATVPVALSPSGVQTLDPAWRFAQMKLGGIILSVCALASV